MQVAPRSTFHAASRQRHYGMDWLRIAAFGLLILFHIAMVFAPWAWVIKAPRTYEALIPPMAAMTPWRLALLFAVSGYASRHLFDRTPDAAQFAASRSRRLLVPLLFGMAMLVPIEMWVRVVEHGYAGSYWHFWARDYWRVGRFLDVDFPSWEHLWFVAYLWAYTMLLAAALAWVPARFARACAAMECWLAEGHRLLWVPLATLIVPRLALLFLVPERIGLLSDWGGHCQYLQYFLFGFVLARSPALWPAIHRHWRGAAAIVLISGAIAVGIEMAWPGTQVPPHGWMALDRAARSAMGWSMVLLLLHVAERWWNRDHRWRKPLAEAVFPFYLVHHPAIVLIAWATLPWRWNPWAEFALLLTGTGAACVLAYLLGLRVPWLGWLIGLPVQRRAIAPAAAQLGAAGELDGEVAAAIGLHPPDRVTAH